MSEEDDILNKLIGKFNYLQGNARVQRARRLFVNVDAAKFDEIFQFAINELKFNILCAITGLDQVSTFAVMYHTAKENGIILSIKKDITKENPITSTITNYFPNAEIYEREMIDLLGIKFQGIPEGKKYPLPDDWPEGQFPLRKDWKASS